MTRANTSPELSQLLTIVLTVVVVTVLYVAKSVVVPLALAVLFTFLLVPLVTWLERIRLPRILAILIVILATGAILGSVGWTVFRQLVQVTDDLPTYTSNINDKIDTIYRSKATSFTRAQEEMERLGQKISILQSAPPTLDGVVPQKHWVRPRIDLFPFRKWDRKMAGWTYFTASLGT